MENLNFKNENVSTISGTQNKPIMSSQANKDFMNTPLNDTEEKSVHYSKHDDLLSLSCSEKPVENKCKNKDLIARHAAASSCFENVRQEDRMKYAKPISSVDKTEKSPSEKSKSIDKFAIGTKNYESKSKMPSKVYHSRSSSNKSQNDSKITDSESKERNESLPENIDLHKPSFSFKRTDSNQPIQMKTKLKSMWNNVKYGWRVKREVNLKLDSPVWLLGKYYHNEGNECSSISQDILKELKLDLFSKIWLTYRINFQKIPGTDFVSDSGWGCMLRCGQMMMAQALVCHFLSRDWRITLDQLQETKNQHKLILRWFGDSLSNESIFSLHRLVDLGLNYGRKVGDWYGPTHVAQVLRDALICSQRNHPELKDICMHVALDGIVFKQDIEDLCFGSSCKSIDIKNNDKKAAIDSQELSLIGSDKGSSLCPENISFANLNNLSLCDERYNFDDPCPSYTAYGPPSFNTANSGWKSLILFVSVRLGNDKINPFYVPCLKRLFEYEHCVGIIGGRPKHALYFIGWQDDKLIHLDPHACQPAVDLQKEDFNEKSFHSSSIRTISFNEMDPSCSIGFYFKTEEQFRYFLENFSEITAPMKRNLDYPIFALAEGRRTDVEEIDSCNAYTRASFSDSSNTFNKDGDDDFILL